MIQIFGIFKAWSQGILVYKGDPSCWESVRAIRSSSQPLPRRTPVLRRSWNVTLRSRAQKRWSFSGGVEFLGILLLSQSSGAKLRRVQSGSDKNHRSDAKCLLQITENSRLVHQTVVISQVLLRRAFRAQKAALFVLLGKSSPFFPELLLQTLRGHTFAGV